MSQQGQWQWAGNAPEVYERELVPAVFAPWAPRLLDLAAPQLGERVLDIACGPGTVTYLAAQRVGATGYVVGLDVNPSMLAVARSVASRPTNVPQATIEWREASAMSLPFSDATFDIVCCQLGLQYFADRSVALREMVRVLVDGGRVALMVWRPIAFSPGFQVLADAFERHVSAEAAAILRAPFALGDADELRSLLRGAGLANPTIQAMRGSVTFPSVARFVQSYIAISPIASQLAQVDDANRTALLRDVQTALEAYTSTTELTFPIEAHLARAQKEETP